MPNSELKGMNTAELAPEPLRCAGPGSECLGDVLHLGLIQIGPIDLAVPTQYLREAIDFPKQLSRLLSTSPYVAGAVDVRGDLIPVVDLRPALGLAATDDPMRRIIIISHRGYLFGVVVDALGGVISVQTTQCNPVEVLSPKDKPLIREVFSIDEGRRVISVLCLEGTMHLCDVPLTVKGQAESTLPQRQTRQHWSPYVLFECGNTRLAIDAHMVDTVINLDGLGHGMNRSDTCLGVVQTESRRTAVLDTLKLLHLGTSAESSDQQVLVLKVDGNAVGLIIRKVTRIARLNDALTRQVPGMAFEMPQLFEGIIPLEGEGDFLKISASQLATLTEVSSMASIHGRPLQEAAEATQMPALKANLGHKGQQGHPLADEGTRAKRRGEVYLTYHVGKEMATPLRQIREILHLPQAMTPINVPGDARVGLFTHREQVIPVLDLCHLLGLGTTPQHLENRLLLIDTSRGVLALLVEQVFAIEHADWEHAPIGIDQLSRMDELQAALHTCSLLTLRSLDRASRGVPAIDLQRVARAIEAKYHQDQAPTATGLTGTEPGTVDPLSERALAESL
jgi:purine-binding chemotaxis protein CheW